MGEKFAVRHAEGGFGANSETGSKFRLELDRLPGRLAGALEGLPLQAFAAELAFSVQSKFRDGDYMVTVLEPGRTGNTRNVEEKAA
jgi:hypothetical protein